MEQANYIKAIFTAVFAFLSALLGVLAVPVILLVACNLIDYATGLMASKYLSLIHIWMLQSLESRLGLEILSVAGIT